MQEIYKDIRGFEGLYQVSTFGNVMSLAKGNGNGYMDRILCPDITELSHTSYARVTLCKDGMTKRFLIHRLVAETFIPNPFDKSDVNHIDNNGLNNDVNNLEWCTKSENMTHSTKQGRQLEVQKLGTQAAIPVNHLRFAKLHQDYLGDNFIAYYPSYMILENQYAKKPIAAVEYLCKECGALRLALTHWAELRKHKGICPNCNQTITLLDEDIVLTV